MMTKADIQYHIDNIGIEMSEILIDLNGGGLSETSNGLLNDRHSELESMLERGKQAMAAFDTPLGVSDIRLFAEVAARAPTDPQERGAWFGRIQALADRYIEPEETTPKVHSAEPLHACELCMREITHHEEWVNFEGSSAYRVHKICHVLKKNEPTISTLPNEPPA